MNTSISVSNVVPLQSNIQCLVSPGAKLPARAHPTDAGADLFAYVGVSGAEIYPNEQKLIDTGVAVKIPVGYVGLLFNRSSQGKKGISIPHSVGVIDSDYRGNIMVLLRNNGEDPYKIATGDKIAQLVIVPIMLCGFVDTWNDTARGTGGFGSTGT